MGASEEGSGKGTGVCLESPYATQRVWGFVASDIPDPRPCIDMCRELFFRRVVPQYDGSDFARVCQYLSRSVASGAEDELLLRQLYCCDSLLCGVRVVKPSGQDPNVNSIINQCQNGGLGGYIISDPGAPPAGYACPLDTVSRDEHGLPCQRPPGLAPEILPDPTIDAGTMTVLTLDTESLSTMPPTFTHGSYKESSAQPAQTSPPSRLTAESGPELSGGGKAAIVVCVLLFFALIAFAILYSRHRGAGTGCPSARSRHHARHQVISSRESPTPLKLYAGSAAMSPRGTPCSPPPRLRERRMLGLLPGPVGPGGYNSGSVSSTPTMPSATYSRFPKSPICAPADNKLIPRNEEAYHNHSGSSFANRDVAVAKPASISSVDSQSTTTVSSPCKPPLSPLRPQRPHESPLEIPGLVRPASEPAVNHGLALVPAPTRPLPPAPAGHASAAPPNSEGATSHMQHPNIGVAISDSAHGDVLRPGS